MMTVTCFTRLSSRAGVSRKESSKSLIYHTQKTSSVPQFQVSPLHVANSGLLLPFACYFKSNIQLCSNEQSCHGRVETHLSEMLL